MLRSIVISCFILILSGAKVDKSPLKKHLRIRDIVHGEYPYVVILLKIYSDQYYEHITLYRRFCSGTALTEQWTLTAAKCVDGRLHKDVHTIHVWYSNFTKSPLETHLFSKILQIYLHPAYTKRLRFCTYQYIDNGISLLRTQNVNVVRYGRLSAVDHTTMIGLPVTFVGGGEAHTPEEDDVRPLQVGEASVIICNKEFKRTAKYLLCVTPKCSDKLSEGWDGETGGPLIHDNQVIGIYVMIERSKFIASMGYVPVSSYIDWISSVLKNK